MARLLLLLAVAMLCLPSAAQDKATGEVLDSVSLKPLSNAAVTLLRGGRTVSFTRTDAKGRFSVEAKAGDRLQVTFMGYRKKAVEASLSRPVRVMLAPSAFVLKEVQVKGTPAYGKQDTTVFDLKRFADERDNSLNDVLKKLPGVNVADNGKISFNGKDISRFTVEGLDLTGGRYNKLNETLKAKDVDRAEVVEHDQPIKALQGKVFTDDVAMNITLRPEARDRWALTLRPELVVGFPLGKTRPQGRADALQVGRKLQRMYGAEYDRSGRDLSANDEVLATGGTAAYAMGAAVPGWFAVPDVVSPIDKERVRFNRSQDYMAKQTRKTKGGSEQRLTAGYLHTDENQETGNTSVYWFDGDSPVTTDETDISSIRHDRVYIDFTHNTNTEKSYGNEYFLIEGSMADGLSRFGDSGQDGVAQRVKTRQLRVSNTFTSLFTRDGHSWQVYSNLDFRYAPMEMAVNGSTQELRNTLYHTDNYARLTLERPRLTHRYAFGFGVDHLRVRGGNTLVSVNATPDWQCGRGKVVVRWSVPLKWQLFAERKEHYLDASPSLTATVKSGVRGEWFFRALYNMTTGGWADIAVSDYRSDYRTRVVNSGVMPRQGVFTALATYEYKRPVKGLFASASMVYGYYHGNMMTDMTISDGDYLLSGVAHDWHSQSASANVFLAKGFFSVNLKTGLRLAYTYSDGQQLSAGEVTGYSSHSVSASPEVVFTPKFGKFTYRGTFSLSEVVTDGMGQNALLDWIQRLSYTQTVGHVDISLSAVHYRNELQTAQVVNTLLADASVVWRMKKVRLSAEVRNIFDKRRYTVTDYSGVMSSTNYYVLRPREIVVNAQFSI